MVTPAAALPTQHSARNATCAHTSLCPGLCPGLCSCCLTWGRSKQRAGHAPCREATGHSRTCLLWAPAPSSSTAVRVSGPPGFIFANYSFV